MRNIPPTWKVDLNKSNYHKNATLTELETVLKPIEEAKEAKTECKEQSGRRNEKDQRRNPRNSMCFKPEHNYEWKEFLENSRNELNRDRYAFHTNEQHSSYSTRERSQINESDDENYSTDLVGDKYSHSEDENNLITNNTPGKTVLLKKPKTRTNVVFSLERDGKRNEHLELIYSGSTGSLISEGLVEEYNLKQTTRNSIETLTMLESLRSKTLSFHSSLTRDQLTNIPSTLIQTRSKNIK